MVAAILAAQQSAEKVNAIELKSKVALANTIYNQNKDVAEDDSFVQVRSDSEDSTESTDSKKSKSSKKTYCTSSFCILLYNINFVFIIVILF